MYIVHTYTVTLSNTTHNYWIKAISLIHVPRLSCGWTEELNEVTSHGLEEAVWLGHTWSLLASSLAVKTVHNKLVTHQMFRLPCDSPLQWPLKRTINKHVMRLRQADNHQLSQSSVGEHWLHKPSVLDSFLVTAGLFTFLYCHLKNV